MFFQVRDSVQFWFARGRERHGLGQSWHQEWPSRWRLSDAPGRPFSEVTVYNRRLKEYDDGRLARRMSTQRHSIEYLSVVSFAFPASGSAMRAF
jgi:hypothetical protein